MTAREVMSVSSDRSWATATLATISTLVGAALGVAGTVYVADDTRDSLRQSEIRDVRRQTYFEYDAALASYVDESLAYYVQADKPCDLYMTLPGEQAPTCVAYDLPEKLVAANHRWFEAQSRLGVFGSSQAVRIEERISDLVKPQHQLMRPWGKAIPELEMAAKSVKNANLLSTARSEFDVLMCTELNGGDVSKATCAARFAYS